MLKFRSHLHNYASIADFEKGCLEKFELAKKELIAVLGVDCNIELSGFNPQFNIEPFYLESFNFSMTCYEYVMTFQHGSSTFDETLVGLIKLRFVQLDENLNLKSLALQHLVIGKLSENDLSHSSIKVSYSVPEKCGNVTVKYSPDVSNGRVMEEFICNDTLVSTVDKATSVLSKLKEAVKHSEAILEPIK